MSMLLKSICIIIILLLPWFLMFTLIYKEINNVNITTSITKEIKNVHLKANTTMKPFYLEKVIKSASDEIVKEMDPAYPNSSKPNTLIKSPNGNVKGKPLYFIMHIGVCINKASFYENEKI